MEPQQDLTFLARGRRPFRTPSELLEVMAPRTIHRGIRRSERELISQLPFDAHDWGYFNRSPNNPQQVPLEQCNAFIRTNFIAPELRVSEEDDVRLANLIAITLPRLMVIVRELEKLLVPRGRGGRGSNENMWPLFKRTLADAAECSTPMSAGE